jgi:hypothetical protein
VNRLTRISLLVLVSSVAAFGDISFQVYATLAPNQFGSPNYNTWQSNALNALENGLTSSGTPGTPGYYQTVTTVDPQDLTVTSFNSWLGTINPGSAFGLAFAGEFGNRGTFPLVIDGNGQQFSISELSFNATSSDPGDVLGFGFGTGSYDYSDAYVGGILTGDPADPIEFITSGPSTQLVDFLWGRGSGNSLWPCGPTDPVTCSTDAQEQAEIFAQAATIAGATYTGTYTLTDPNNNVLGSASATFDITTPEPSTLALLALGLASLLCGSRGKLSPMWGRLAACGGLVTRLQRR